VFQETALEAVKMLILLFWIILASVVVWGWFLCKRK